MRLSSNRWFRRVWLCFAMLGVLGAIFVLSNVDTDLSKEDIEAFSSAGLAPPLRPLTFAQEVTLIRDVQAIIMKKSPVKKGISRGLSREPADLFQHGYGTCYDRSRVLDKAYEHMGFEARHVFMLYRREDISFWRVLLSKGQLSHAVTEVKTSQGWLIVDSTSNWISVNQQGLPIDADHVSIEAAQFGGGMPEYMTRPAWAIRGLYSRHGRFFHKYSILPELNYADFFIWWFGLV
jgi:hypothetical protein